MHVPLITLAIDEIANVRRTGRGAEPIFTASIRAKGVIEPLTVRKNGGDGYKVVNGGKRLAALHWLSEHGETAAGVKVDGNYPVPVTVRDEDDREARDTSLITNTVRAGMHPVDEFEAFAALAAEGMPAAEIAARYALDEKQVRQRLALGRLAPRIREAWREGEIGADHAKAFTLAAAADQEKIFAALKKSGQLRWGANTVRERIVGKQGDVGKLVAFVGADALRKAGVDLREDLFGEAHTVPDPKVVMNLAGEKLAAECARLTGEGWSWASVESDLPQGARWSWSTLPAKKAKPTKAEAKRLKELQAILDEQDENDPSIEDIAAADEIDAIEAAIAARSYSAEDKARSGCILAIGHRGDLEIKHAVLKPEEAKREKARQRAEERKKNGKAEPGDTPAEAEPAGPDISNALAHDLSVKMTLAVREALQAERHIALAALVAGFLGNSPWSDPIRVQNEGFGNKHRRGEETFAGAFERLKAFSPEDLLAAAAGVAGETVSLESYGAPDRHPMTLPGTAALANAIDPGRLALALAANFDAEDFFKRASMKVALDAIAEMGVEAKPKKKPEAVKAASDGARQTGWLPRQLRTMHYAGPGKPWSPADVEDEGPPAGFGDVDEEQYEDGEE